jgi:hypothetical protein
MLGQFVTRMRKFIGQSDVKHMTCLVKTITSVLKASTDIITDIPACPIGLTEVLAIVSVSTFKITVILYVLVCLMLLFLVKLSACFDGQNDGCKILTYVRPGCPISPTIFCWCVGAPKLVCLADICILTGNFCFDLGCTI